MINKKCNPSYLKIKCLVYVLVSLALLNINSLQAVSATRVLSAKSVIKTDIYQDPVKTGGVYVTPQKMPEFPGGDNQVMTYLAQNLQYPVKAVEDNIEGRVVVRFVVRYTGDIGDVEVIQGVHPLLDNEAVKVIKRMPKWKPGVQDGKSVDVFYTMPIVFRLPHGLKSETSANQAEEAEVKNTEFVAINDTIKTKTDSIESKPFVMVEKMPSFPGGERELHAFIGRNLNYPVEAQKTKTQGRVLIRFVVDKIGQVKDVTLLRGVDPLLDAEALRVVKLMPKWIPGQMGGKDVSVYFTLPIVFRLTEDTVQPDRIIVYNGDFMSEADFIKVIQANLLPKEKIKTVILPEVEAFLKYGQRVKGKEVIEITTLSE